MEAHEGWRKSSRSQQGSNNCVEARVAPEGPQLSDSKLAGEHRPIITLDEASFVTFIEHIKSESLRRTD
ncbi:DUF397 domain-containing protein [Glycomyces sp. MUSA5-2]|uniref:DUF397 domain-containing protein n=1 Tax=Glycomyces sp. MUSA5-2 TaxID=2053002 RepID=UPI00300A3AA7